MPLVNLTPHQMGFLLRTPDGDRIVNLPPSGKMCRVTVTNTTVGDAEDIPVVCPEEGRIVGLPEPSPGVIYIASSIVARIVGPKGRCDVLSPDTTEKGVVRDGSKQVVAVRNLQSFAPPAEVVAFLEEYRRINTGSAPVIAANGK